MAPAGRSTARNCGPAACQRATRGRDRASRGAPSLGPTAPRRPHDVATVGVRAEPRAGSAPAPEARTLPCHHPPPRPCSRTPSPCVEPSLAMLHSPVSPTESDTPSPVSPSLVCHPARPRRSTRHDREDSDEVEEWQHSQPGGTPKGSGVPGTLSGAELGREAPWGGRPCHKLPVMHRQACRPSYLIIGADKSATSRRVTPPLTPGARRPRAPPDDRLSLARAVRRSLHRSCAACAPPEPPRAPASRGRAKDCKGRVCHPKGRVTDEGGAAKRGRARTRRSLYFYLQAHPKVVSAVRPPPPPRPL